MELVEGKYLEYKDRPLVREGNTICYGDLNEKYMLMLNIISEKDNGEPEMIMVQICHKSEKSYKHL